MPTIDETKDLAGDVIEIAIWARMHEAMQHVRNEAEQQDAMSEKAIAGYREEFAWISERFASFTGLDTGDNDTIGFFYDQMVHEGFGVPGEDHGVPKELPDGPFDEFHALGRAIDPDDPDSPSRGKAFEAFTVNFLDKADQMWRNQTAIAKCLGATAVVVNAIYDRAREDVAKVASGARQAFADIYEYKGGDRLSFMLGIVGLASGILGFVETLATEAGVIGLATSVGGYAVDAPHPVDPGNEDGPQNKTETHIGGDTTEEISDSLNTALNEILKHLGEAESHMKRLLGTLNDMLSKANPHSIRGNVVAPDLSFPR